MKNRKAKDSLATEWTRLLLRYNAAVDQYQESDRRGKLDPGAMERIRDTLLALAEVAEANRQAILSSQKAR